MAKKSDRSQPPYTPEQARARSKAAPKGQTVAGRSGGSRVGEKGATKHMWKPGMGAGPRGR